MLFRSVAKCSAYGTNAMHCTSKHRRCDTTTALVREIPETLFVPAHAEGDIFIPERRSQPVNDPMTFLDFFSGVGGFRKGFELCGNEPSEYDEIYAQGVDEEIANRPDWQGNTVDDVCKYRDKMFVQLLKLQKLL